MWQNRIKKNEVLFCANAAHWKTLRLLSLRHILIFNFLMVSRCLLGKFIIIICYIVNFSIVTLPKLCRIFKSDKFFRSNKNIKKGWNKKCLVLSFIMAKQFPIRRGTEFACSVCVFDYIRCITFSVTLLANTRSLSILHLFVVRATVQSASTFVLLPWG